MTDMSVPLRARYHRWRPILIVFVAVGIFMFATRKRGSIFT